MSQSMHDVTAVIMAGGKGTRLKPFTAVLPKPLVPIGDMSILELLLRRISGFGFGRVVISTGHLSGLIRAVAGDGHEYGLDLEYCHEDCPLGTAGALGQISELSGPVITMNGDLLTDLDFRAVYGFHVDTNADVTIATRTRNVKIDFGVVDFEPGGVFKGFAEKPSYDLNVSMGVNVLGPAALSMVQAGVYLDMPDLITAVHAAGGKVRCFSADCYWLDIGRVDDYALAQEEFQRNRELFLDEKQ